MRAPLLSLTLLLALPQAAAALTPAEVFAKASPSVVVIETFDAKGKEDGQGSGVVVGPGLVVTNCHVIKTADTVQVVYAKRRISASVRDIDVDRDLCSLDARGLVAPIAMMGTSRLRVGESVYTIGAPQGLALTLGQGILSSRRGEGEYQLLQTTAPISPGSSGGGLFDESGRLIGITTLFHKEGQALNFAVPVEWISEMPARWQAVLDADDSATGDAAAEAVQAAADAAAAAVDAAAAAADAAATAADAAAASAADEEPIERWIEIRDNGIGIDYIDRESIEFDGDIARAWFKSEYHKPQKSEEGRLVAYAHNLHEYNCSKRTWRITAARGFSKTGTIVYDEDADYLRFERVAPETIAETHLKILCGLKDRQQ